MKFGAILVVAVVAFIAAALQQALAPRISFLGARPDFPLLALALITMNVDRVPGLLCGFFIGLLQGALPTANLAHYIVSRTLTGYLVSASNQLRLHPSAPIVFATVALATVFGQTVWMFIAAPGNIGAFLGDTIGTAVVNGVLAMPLNVLLRKFLGPPKSS
ncbi:MAG TPA: rod shape-determining protein MreD [Fimbriimonadaceae bacterium]|nr:rod shape-determining protein MreD [Fimbriimonadaceae bacterium]